MDSIFNLPLKQIYYKNNLKIYQKSPKNIKKIMFLLLKYQILSTFKVENPNKDGPNFSCTFHMESPCPRRLISSQGGGTEGGVHAF